MLIENNVGEAPHDSPSIVFVCYLINLRIAPDELNASINTTKKLFTQTKFLFFILDISLGYIQFRLRQNDQISRYHTARDEFAPSLLPMNFLSQGSANKQPFS